MNTEKREKNPIIARIKKENNSIAEKIRTMRGTRKQHINGCVPGLIALSKESRCRHIVYCELRGKKREDIEKPRETNKANENIIKGIRKIWEDELKAFRGEDPVIVEQANAA